MLSKHTHPLHRPVGPRQASPLSLGTGHPVLAVPHTFPAWPHQTRAWKGLPMSGHGWLSIHVSAHTPPHTPLTWPKKTRFGPLILSCFLVAGHCLQYFCLPQTSSPCWSPWHQEPCEHLPRAQITSFKRGDALSPTRERAATCLLSSLVCSAKNRAGPTLALGFANRQRPVPDDRCP